VQSRVFARSASSRCSLQKGALRSQLLPINIYACRSASFPGRAFELANLQWCVRGWQCDFRCFPAIPSQCDRICSLVLCLADSRCGARFSCCVRSLCVCQCVRRRIGNVLSLFGDAVSASYVPFQSDHKVMAHTMPYLLQLQAGRTLGAELPSSPYTGPAVPGHVCRSDKGRARPGGFSRWSQVKSTHL
jgi:hypothetical protein